nr:protein CELLULOSE SYNTHASE INTERACTIVE 1-like [Ipomoea batatas]
MEKMIRTQKQLSLVCTYLWFADQHPLALGIKSSHLSYSKQRVYESDLLEDQPTEEMKVVAICALQNLVMYSRSNKRTLLQAAMFIKLLFSNNTIQEYASGETVRAITAALEKDLWATGAVNEEYLKALNSLFGNFSRLRATEPATLSIPHLVTALKTGTLVVIIKRGNNMRQSVGNASAYCKLTLGNTPPVQTKVVSTGSNPEWDESFAWSFESPPKGQKLHISCKNKSKMGKSSFGKVTIQIDRVVMLGAVSGEYTLLPESKSGPSRNLEIEFQWSNKTEL